MLITIKIKYAAETKSICCDTEMVLEDLRLIASEMFNIAPGDITFSLGDRILFEERRTLGHHGLCDSSTLSISIRRGPGEGGPKNTQTDLFSNPMVKSLMKNPDAMKSMLGMFPGIESEMETNEELRQILNNPNMAEEMQRMAEDPEYFNTQAKNADVAMARLETIPGSLNMISSMLGDVSDPFASMMAKPGLKGGEKIEKPVTDAVPNADVKENFIVKYRKELNDLKNMGFTDIKRNVSVLKQCNGDIEQTIRVLTGV